MKTFKLFLIICGFLLPSSTYAEPIQYEDWQLVCDPRPCGLTQSAVDGSLKVTVSQRRQGLFALVAVPLGINLPAGLSAQVDQQPVRRYSFATCTVAGCFSAIPLAASKLLEWQRGRALKLTYQDGEATSISSTISLLGFTAGNNALLAATD
ncbi:MAG: invasion associated locus B family protein [Phyllobacteriaceae bacterium]|nr:invasion associated locus B family protein [Phyllobacteriaceae bacterium]